MHSLSPPGCTRSGRLLVALVPTLALAAASSLSARGQPPGQLKPLDKEQQVGHVVEVGPGILKLRLPMGGEVWNALPAPNARIEVIGKASREMLQPKQFINCVVSLDELGKVTAPVLQLSFTDAGTPGVMAGGIGIAEPGAKRVAGKRPAGTYTVAGTIKHVEGDVVTVVAGRDRFDLPVPAEAELLVRTTNVGLASRGDVCEVEGQYYQAPQLLLSSLKITLANPVTPPRSKSKTGRPQ